MAKKNALKFVNILLALSFVMTAFGGLTRFFAPAIIPYATFKLIHPYFGLFFVATAVAHITLNFAWIKSTYLKK